MGNASISYWRIKHDPDLTETGLPMRSTYVQAIWTGLPDENGLIAVSMQRWCIQRFDGYTALVQGIAPTWKWYLERINQDEFNAAQPIVWGGHPTETRCIVMSVNDSEATIESDNALTAACEI